MSKKKTQEEYISELSIKNPTVEVIEKYIDANTKIKHHCLIHNVYWNTTPSRALQGVGCEMCRKEKFRLIRCKSNKQFIKELKNVNPNIIALEKYVDAKTPMMFKCMKHNVEWKAYPDGLLRGCGCVMCGYEKIKNKNQKTHEQYVKELYKANKNISVIDIYVNSNTPILHKCLIDGYEWRTSPSNILSGTGCPKCAGSIKVTQDEYISKVFAINPNLKVVGKYVNMRTPLEHYCKKHDIFWKVQPSSILSGCGCVECGKEKSMISKRRSQEEYIEKVKEINCNIKVIDEYVNSNTPILHKCLIDRNEWKVSPSSILSGHGCPKCNESKGEKEICQYLDKHNIEYIREQRFDDCRDIKPLPFDFYLPKENICIEYQGEQHYRPIKYFGGNKAFETRVKHDYIKSEYCKNNGILLLHIPYNENTEEELNNFLFI